MSDHVIYAKPVTVTEEKLKEALAKQAKQKALKEALDRQILEAERVKKEEASRAGHHNAVAGRGGSVPDAEQQPTSPNRSPVNSLSPPQDKRPEGKLPAKPEMARYTLSFNGERANFVKEDGAVGDRQSPSGAQGRQVGSSPRGQGQDATKARRSTPNTRARMSEEAGKPPTTARHATPRGSEEGERRTSSVQSRQQRQQSREAKLAALAVPKNRKLTSGARMARRERAVTPTYQTNSLPVDLDVGEKKPRGASKARNAKAGADPTYDTQSLPVDLVYRLGKDGAGAGNHPQPRSVRPAAERSPSSRALRQRSSPEIEGIITTTTTTQSPGSADYNTGCLPRDFSLGDEFTAQYRAAKGKWSAQRPQPWRQAPSSSRPPSDGGLLPAKPALGYGKDGRKLSPRTPGRPAGGILPPLPTASPPESHDSVIEMSAVLSAPGETGSLPDGAPSQQRLHRPPLLGTPASDRRQGGAGRASSRDARATAHPQEVDRLQQQQPDTRDNMVRRMQAKERSWEDQVQRLKAELRHARKKERELSRANPSETVPKRAETAPDPPSPAHKATHRLRQLSNDMVHGKGTAGEGPGGNGGGGRRRPIAVQESRGKPDFSRAHVFTAEEFRPITAPDFPEHSYVPSTSRDQRGGKAGSGEGAIVADRARGPPRSTGDVEPLSLAETAASSSVLGASEASLKLASLTTWRTTFGLQEGDASIPAPIAFDHLVQFADAQIITHEQAESLWTFFCELRGVAVRYDSSGRIARQCEESGGDAAHGQASQRFDSDNSLDSDSSDSESEDQEENDIDGDGGGASILEEGQQQQQDEENPSTEEAQTPPRRPPRPEESAHRDDYYPSQSPVSAFLAPALRKKVSRMHAAVAAVAGGGGGGGGGAARGLFHEGEWPTRPPSRANSDSNASGQTAAHTPPPQQPQQQVRSLGEKNSADRVGSSRSPASHSSEGATVGEDEEEEGDDAAVPLEGQDLEHSKQSGRVSRAAARRDRTSSETFDTSVELYASS